MVITVTRFFNAVSCYRKIEWSEESLDWVRTSSISGIALWGLNQWFTAGALWQCLEIFWGVTLGGVLLASSGGEAEDAAMCRTDPHDI